MKRFTERVVNEYGSCIMDLCETCPILDDKGCNRECLKAALTLLTDYEDTGLTPDEINNRKMIPMTFESISISPKAERAMIGVENALLYQIKKLKSYVKSDNSDYLKGYLCALSAVEGIIEEGKSENNDQT